MPEEWKIEIFDDPDGGVIFRPDVRFAKDGQPLIAEVNDIVSWSNRTEHELILEVLEPKNLQNFNRTIAPGDQTSFFPIPIATLPIKYCCKDFPQEHEIKSKDSFVG